MKRSMLVHVGTLMCLLATLLTVPTTCQAFALAITVISQSAPDTPAQSQDGLAGSSTYSFDQTSGPFAADFDDVYSGETRYNYTAHLSDDAATAIISYNPHADPTWTDIGGFPASSFFSPSFNRSSTEKGFVGFLGNDINGVGADVTVQPTEVADIVNASDPTILYGLILADYSFTQPETTTFTILNFTDFTFDASFGGANLPLQPAPPDANPIPEPSSMALLGLGAVSVVALSFVRARRNSTP